MDALRTMIDRLERLINLVIALRETRRPLTAEEVHRRVAGYGQDDHEAFRRMFERDKADLRALGVPVETAVDAYEDRAGYRIDPRSYDLPEVRLSADELTALSLAVEATGLADEARRGLLKLQVDSGEPAGSDSPAPAVEFDLESPHRTRLMEAQLTRTTVRFDYGPPGSPVQRRTVDPHALVHRRGRWYVIGHDHDRNDRRAFRLDRIAGSVRTVGRPEAFDPPAGVVEVDAVVPGDRAGGPVTVEVLAEEAVAWQVARRARGGGRPGPDGRTAFTVAGGDPADLVRWVLGFGPDVEVVGPPEIRAAVIEQLRAAVTSHARAVAGTEESVAGGSP